MKRFIALAVFVVAIAVIWTGGWFYVAGRVEAEIALLETADGYTQPRLTCGGLSVGGFPFQFHPRCDDARITSGDLDIALPRIDATALFYRPTHIQLFAEGPATITDAFYGTTQEVSWQNLRGSIRLEGDRIGRVSLAGTQLAYADALLGTTVVATADALELHLVDAPNAETPAAGDALDVYVSAENATAPALDLAQGEVVIDGRITGLPPLSLLTSPYALSLWQANGGALTLRTLEATASDLALDASGEARLDEQGRVNGTLALASRGLAERLRAFIEPELAEVFLGAVNEEGYNTQRITINEGVVQVGIIPVQTIPPLFY